ncbi:F-box only protein 28 isoform X2 [Calliphora vicina]|uniref:F-box only protein 28 isoform X2 n=1 Tax=Calliphora vicina TaxID=7373 RepID=UPI00325A4D6F
MYIFDLPNVMLIEIFEYLSYDEVSKKRLVCRRFDQIAQQVLNGGFNKVIKQHNVSFKRIKALLPRRESERRNHCLARHADILTSIETRISMLSMTYTKYMDLNLCCFIPGRVLDEIFRILRLISKTNKPLRPHEVLQELRDISSMAIEHFDERIANNLKKTFVDSSKMCGGSGYCADTRRLAATSGLGFIGERLSGNSLKTTLSDNEPLQASLPSTSTGILEQYQHPVGGCPEARTTMVYFKKLETEYKKGIVKMHRMQQVQNLQNKRLQQTLSSVAELNVQIVELKKRLEDVDAKNREISANIRHISGGEPTKTENLTNTTTAKIDGNNEAKDETSSSSSPSTSTLVAQTSDNNSNKRRIDVDGQLLSNPKEDTIDKPEENCDLQMKKPKLQS